MAAPSASTSTKPTSFTCSFPGCESPPKHACVNCKFLEKIQEATAHYCSAEHQKGDWPRHKSVCIAKTTKEYLEKMIRIWGAQTENNKKAPIAANPQGDAIDRHFVEAVQSYTPLLIEALQGKNLPENGSLACFACSWGEPIASLGLALKRLQSTVKFSRYQAIDLEDILMQKEIVSHTGETRAIEFEEADIRNCQALLQSNSISVALLLQALDRFHPKELYPFFNKLFDSLLPNGIAIFMVGILENEEELPSIDNVCVFPNTKTVKNLLEIVGFEVTFEKQSPKDMIPISPTETVLFPITKYLVCVRKPSLGASSEEKK